jgi:hypothetical protein
MQPKYTVSACIALFLTLAASLAAQTALDFETALDGGGGVVITRYTGWDRDVRIPVIINGNLVTGIGDWAFAYCDNLTSVTIPDGVTTIGEAAFAGCSGLKAINVLPENRWYKSIDGVLFTKDGKIFHTCPAGNTRTTYTIPTGVVIIGDWAFYRCSGLTSVTIPASVTTIDEGAFHSSGLTSVTIPVGVTTIGGWAFAGCSGLASVTIPASVTTIGEGAFAECTGLTSVTIPAGVTGIGAGAFFRCSGLISVTMQAGVTTIGDWAFAYCSGLTSVMIPASVTGIGKEAFAYCSGLQPDLRADIERRFGSGVFE